jgi:phosphoglycolate phosphatase-like HAD superfamily hydrolase
MIPQVRLAWLFDIDGTLLVTDGAAREAFSRAARDVLGVEDDLSAIAFAGRIEPMIAADIFARHGRRPDPGTVDRYWDSVLTHMRVVLRPGRGRLLPGVLELLEAVEREPGWVATLLTGNMTPMARIKLEHFGLAERFPLGAFGEEAVSRSELARLAVRRIGERFGVPPRRCVVVGDTEHDVRCAREAGARAVAVATGPSDRAALEGHGPDLVLDDLTRVEQLLRWARNIAEE